MSDERLLLLTARLTEYFMPALRKTMEDAESCAEAEELENDAYVLPPVLFSPHLTHLIPLVHLGICIGRTARGYKHEKNRGGAGRVLAGATV